MGLPSEDGPRTGLGDAELPKRTPNLYLRMKNAMTSAAAQGQIARGLGVSWVAQFIQIAAGFIVPRWIDHGLGRETLGVWDLGWSFVSYLTLLEAGIGSSVNRHVALHRADGDATGV